MTSHYQAAENRVSPEQPAADEAGTLSLSQCRSLSSAEASKLFFHSIREGNTDQALLLLRVRPSLANDVDEQLLGPLHYAVKFNRVNLLPLLMQAGANVNQSGREGAKPLHVAANLNQTEAIQVLLSSRKIRVDATDDRGQTALQVACRRNQEDAVKILLNNKASLQLKSLDGSSALHGPARRNNLKLCQTLTNYDTSLIWSTDKHGVTPLMLAAAEGTEDLLNHFIGVCKQSGVDVAQNLNLRDTEGNSAMHCAARNNRAAALEILRDCGADVNAQNTELSTPLHLAAALGHRESAEKLLSLGALPSLPDKMRRTPLHWCVIARQPEICRVLLDAGAATRAVDTDLMTPLHWACRRRQIDVARELLDADPEAARLLDVKMRSGLHWAALAPPAASDGADELGQLILDRAAGFPDCDALINASDFHDKCPAHYAVEMNNPELLKSLLTRGADFHATDTEGRTPVQVAVKLGFGGLVRDICGHSDSLRRQTLRHRDATGMTSLLIAAESGCTEVFKLLLGLGADFTVRDELGRTALMLSVGSGHHDIATIVIDKGVDVNASDANRNTALHYASKFVSPTDARCLELLLSNGALLQQNYSGETPVDVAVLNNNGPVIEMLFSDTYRHWVMSHRRDDGKTHMDILIRHSPQTAMTVLNNSVTESTSDRLDKNFMVSFDFFQLDPGPDDPSSAHARYFALRTMVRKRRMELLQHPLSQALLECKWSFSRYFLWCDFVVYAIFLVCLTAFVSDNSPLTVDQIDSSTGCRNVTVDGVQTGQQQNLTDTKLILEKCIVMGILCVRILLELVKMIFKRLQYFRNYENIFFLLMYAFTFAFMYPPQKDPCLSNWLCGLFSVIMAWGLLIFEFEHLPVTGIYSLMFQQVIFSLVKVLAMFTFCIVGFALAFHIGLVSQTPYAYVMLSVLKTFDMTVGEMDFVTYFISGVSGDMQTGLFVVFVIFVIFMPIGLTNLLVGIAVGDIEGISREASLRLIEIRVNLVYELETNLMLFFQRRLYKRFMEVYPNRRYNRLAEFMWPYGALYRDWLKLCADSRAVETNEERLEAIEAGVQKLSARLEDLIQRAR